MFEDDMKKKHDDFFKSNQVNAKGFFARFGIVALFVMLINLAIGLGFIAGICWIVKYFFIK